MIFSDLGLLWGTVIPQLKCSNNNSFWSAIFFNTTGLMLAHHWCQLVTTGGDFGLCGIFNEHRASFLAYSEWCWWGVFSIWNFLSPFWINDILCHERSVNYKKSEPVERYNLSEGIYQWNFSLRSGELEIWKNGRKGSQTVFCKTTAFQLCTEMSYVRVNKCQNLD